MDLGALPDGRATAPETALHYLCLSQDQMESRKGEHVGSIAHPFLFCFRFRNVVGYIRIPRRR